MNPMEKIYQSLRHAFPKMPVAIFEKNKIILSQTYLRKWNRYFDFQAMYETKETKDRPN